MKEMGEIFEAGQGREFSGDVAYAAHLFPSWASVRNHPTVIYASTKRGERLRLLFEATHERLIAKFYPDWDMSKPSPISLLNCARQPYFLGLRWNGKVSRSDALKMWLQGRCGSSHHEEACANGALTVLCWGSHAQEFLVEVLFVCRVHAEDCAACEGTLIIGDSMKLTHCVLSGMDMRTERGWVSEIKRVFRTRRMDMFWIRGFQATVDFLRSRGKCTCTPDDHSSCVDALQSWVTSFSPSCDKLAPSTRKWLPSVTCAMFRPQVYDFLFRQPFFVSGLSMFVLNWEAFKMFLRRVLNNMSSSAPAGPVVAAVGGLGPACQPAPEFVPQPPSAVVELMPVAAEVGSDAADAADAGDAADPEEEDKDEDGWEDEWGAMGDGDDMDELAVPACSDSELSASEPEDEEEEVEECISRGTRFFVPHYGCVCLAPHFKLACQDSGPRVCFLSGVPTAEDKIAPVQLVCGRVVPFRIVHAGWITKLVALVMMGAVAW